MPTAARLLSHPVPSRPLGAHDILPGPAEPLWLPGYRPARPWAPCPPRPLPPEATILVANFGSDNPASYTLAGEGSALPDVHVLGQGFSGPDAIAVAGNDVFVANQNSNSVTELNASTGAAVRVVSGAAYQITYPLTLAVAGNDLFVANGGSADGSVTKLKASTGTLVKVIAGPPPRFGP